MRKFNVTGLCIPNKHYMVYISDKLKKIIELVNDSQYFVINCPRQYGKTTSLACLKQLLDYIDTKNADKGYLLIFDFRKNIKKEQRTEWVQIENKMIFSVIL